MRILLVNDDGFDAVGINVLAETFCRDYDIFVAAPSEERSAFSHSLSIMHGLKVEKKEFSNKNIRGGMSVFGTPADCVKFAILEWLKDSPPDLIISGINNGGNLGTDIMYSGTVSAAMEGAYLSIPSIAISLVPYKAKKQQFEYAAKYLHQNLGQILNLNLSSDVVLNINHPGKECIAGTKFTKAGYLFYFDRFEVDSDTGLYEIRGSKKDSLNKDIDCDIEWIAKDYVSITPLTLDRNDYKTLKKIKKVKL